MNKLLYLEKECFEGRIEEPDILRLNSDVRKTENVYFLTQEERYMSTSMKFPSRVTRGKEQQVQKLNYECFIQTMADMVEKYSKEIEDLCEV